MLNLPGDFAQKIAETLNWKLSAVQETFMFEEDKEGFFWAKLKPKIHLDKPDFVAVCKLTRDLGGEDYLQGARAWKVPGPLAKKGAEKPSAGGTHSEPAYKEPGNAIPTGPRVQAIRLDAISIPAFLPTRELITHEKLARIRDSMKKHGLKYAIKLRPGSEPGKYELVDGYLRLTSAQQLSWKEIQAEISERTDEQVIVESVITNKDRIEEDPITLAKKFDILVNAFGWTQEKLAQELGIDQPTVSNHIRLLRLPKEVQHYLALNNVSFYHALLLLQLEDAKLQVGLAKEIIESGLSSRDLETRIRELQPKQETPEKHEETPKPSGPAESPTPQDNQMQRDKEVICDRCGEPIGGTPVYLGDGKYYDAECAEEVVAEAKPSALQEDHVGSFGPELTRPTELGHVDTNEDRAAIAVPTPSAGPKVSGPVQIGTFECTECKQHFIIEHLPNGKHKLKQIRSVER